MALSPDIEAKLRAAAGANAAASKARENELKKRVTDAIEAEKKGDLETAFKGYTSLYNSGFIPAAFYLGNLYMHRGFRATEEKDEQTGQVIRRPDLKSALDWYRKAADRGIREAMCNAGIMLVLGHGSEADRETGKKYLVKARDAGSDEARSFLFQNFNEERSSVTYTDEEYTELLTKFINLSVQGNAAECHKLFFKLVCGNDEQLSSLGTVLALHKYTTGNPFVNRMNQNSYPKLSNGMPCVPIYLAKRAPGASTLHLNTKCFPEGKIRLTLCSSIDDLTLFPLSGIEELEDLGTVSYTSSPFGNMPATRSARLLELTPEEDADVCIFTENGNTEYLVELGWLDEADNLHFMFKYAVDLRVADLPGAPTLNSITLYSDEPIASDDEVEADEPSTKSNDVDTVTEDETVDEPSDEVADTVDEPAANADVTSDAPEKKGFFKKIFKKN